ncbi:MAG: ABC transporter substrate-binding protein [Woeseiaceae bacterium]|nr:ABC transporter substrate-binding protein [Woeseiaceae bacterium]
MKRILLTLTTLMLTMPAAFAESPNLIIEEAAELLAASLDGRKEELAADRDALHELINGILLPRFDRRYSAQLVLGRHWRTASNDQRQRFIDAFYNALLQRYADGVLEYDQDRVEILPFRGDASKPRTMVRSIVTLNDGSKVPVNYGLVKRENGWLLFDVTIEGVSYIRNFRAELDSEIRSTSLAAVIERLESEAT